MADIEPAFAPLIPICRELPTSAGFLDNLWLTPNGGIILGECKLVRNPQARREVVAQALDYARAVADWRFEDLQAAALKGQDVRVRSLWEAVEAVSELDERQFVDAVERRLRAGRFLILIIGDGIQEGVEALTSHLQLHAGLHVGLALVDLSIWQMPDAGLVIVPRIPMRTVLVERGIVIIEPPKKEGGIDASNVRIIAPQERQSRPKTASEGEFYAGFEQRRPNLVAPLRDFIETVSGFGITPEPQKSLFLRWQVGDDLLSAAAIDAWGKVWFAGAYSNCKRAGREEAASDYLAAVAALVGGRVKLVKTAGKEVVDSDGRAVDLSALLKTQGAWAAAISRLLGDIAPNIAN